jgi:hypothetical protein
MSNLLSVTRFATKAGQRKSAVPLLVEFKVQPETAPYLVTSTSSLLWVEEPHPGAIAKAAVRVCAPGVLFMEILQEILKRSLADEWANVQPYSKQGFEAVKEHLASYALTEVDVLVAPEKDKGARPEWLRGIPVQPASWLPEGWVVVVPKDREFLGLLGHVTSSQVVALVHNAGRCIGILKD